MSLCITAYLMVNNTVPGYRDNGSIQDLHDQFLPRGHDMQIVSLCLLGLLLQISPVNRNEPILCAILIQSFQSTIDAMALDRGSTRYLNRRRVVRAHRRYREQRSSDANAVNRRTRSAGAHQLHRGCLRPSPPPRCVLHPVLCHNTRRAISARLCSKPSAASGLTSVQSNLAKGRIADRSLLAAVSGFVRLWTPHESVSIRRLNRFIRFCAVHPYDQHKHTNYTRRTTSVAIGRIVCTACKRCGLRSGVDKKRNQLGGWMGRVLSPLWIE